MFTVGGLNSRSSFYYRLPVVEKCLEKRLAFTSADINFYNFLEFHSKFLEKKIFVTNFPFQVHSNSLSPELPKSAKHDKKFLSMLS